jgi:hypothetical protein
MPQAQVGRNVHLVSGDSQPLVVDSFQEAITNCMQIYKLLTSPHLPLPWEEGRMSPEDSKKLGRFRKPILKLLQREPSQRDTALQFCKSMLEIFSSTPGGSAVQKDTMHVNW